MEKIKFKDYKKVYNGFWDDDKRTTGADIKFMINLIKERTVMQSCENTYEERNSRQNDAEVAFEKLAKQKKWFLQRWGFDEKNHPVPSYSFQKIPKSLRCAPDYLVIFEHGSFCFVEVKGFSGQIKIKKSDLEVYNSWQKNHKDDNGNKVIVAIFAWQKTDSSGMTIKLDDINEIIESGELEIAGKYNDSGEEYYEIPFKLCKPMRNA